MAETVVVISTAEFSPNPVAAGSPTKLQVTAFEVVNTPAAEVVYTGEIYAGEV